MFVFWPFFPIIRLCILLQIALLTFIFSLIFVIYTEINFNAIFIARSDKRPHNFDNGLFFGPLARITSKHQLGRVGDQKGREKFLVDLEWGVLVSQVQFDQIYILEILSHVKYLEDFVKISTNHLGALLSWDEDPIFKDAEAFWPLLLVARLIHRELFNFEDKKIFLVINRKILLHNFLSFIHIIPLVLALRRRLFHFELVF